MNDSSTWKWVVGLLLGLLLSVLSYSAMSIDTRVSAAESEAMMARHRTEINTQAMVDILRRLDKLDANQERILDRLEKMSMRGFSSR